MKRLRLTVKYRTYLLSALLPFLFMCASTRRGSNCGLAQKYTGTTALNVQKSILVDGLQSLLLSFNDSALSDTLEYLWRSYHPGPPDTAGKKDIFDIHNISTMTAILKSRGYCVALLDPATYEGIDALSKLPVLIWMIVIHHPDNQNTLVRDTNLTIRSAALNTHADNIRLHLIDNITKENSSYTLVARDGLTLRGLETDNLSSQITAVEEKHTSQYLQIVDCIIVSSLPLLELSGHLNEWYASIPYRNIKPVIKEVP